LPEKIREGVNGSLDLLRDKKDAEQKAQQFAEGMAKQAELENMVKTADAASKGSQPVEQGSPTAMALGMR